MELTKNDIIQQFKDACNDIMNIKAREMSVGYQNTRYIWELPNMNHCLIRIQNPPNENPKIVFFCSIDYANKNNIVTNNNAIEFELTIPEYNDLECLFYGDFIADNKYFRKWNVISSNNRDLENKPKWFEFRKMYKNYITDISRKEHLFN